jgi:hypothetical protein
VEIDPGTHMLCTRLCPQRDRCDTNPSSCPSNLKFRNMILNQDEVIMKQNLIGLPSEVAKRMTFEEQFALIITISTHFL